MRLLRSPFIQSRRCMRLTFTGELCVMRMKNDAKFEEDLICSFKIDMKNLTNFDPRRILTNFNLHFNGLLLTKYIMFELKKLQRSYVWLHWRLMQNLKENWLVLSKMTWRIWQIFVHKLKNRDFILESKMVELNKNLKPPDRPNAVWKLYFTLEINE